MSFDLGAIENLVIVPALKKLIEKDSELITLQPREECINHRLAVYIEEIVSKLDMFSYHIDAEYDKRVDGEKDVYLDGQKINIRPDILVHERRQNRNNLLVIEAKKNTPRKHDINKIQGLMGDDYKYTYGCSVSYLPKDDKVRYALYYKSKGEFHCKIGFVSKITS